MGRQSAVITMCDKSEAVDDKKKLCETVEQGDEENWAMEALAKLRELVSCGDKRIELSSAKEVLSLLGVPETLLEDKEVTKLEVEIKVI